MSRPAPTTIAPISPIDLASIRPVAQPAEDSLMDNGHYLWCYYGPTIVSQHYRAEDASPYIAADTTERIYGFWRRTMLPGFTHWRVAVLVENTSGSDAGSVKARFQSDPSTLVASASVAASTGQWTEVTITVAVDSTQTRDTLELLATSGATGAVRIHHVHVRPVFLTSVAAGKDASGWIPNDTNEVDADKPHTVETRGKQLKNPEIIRKARTDSILHWAENSERASASAFESTANDYEIQIAVRYLSHPGETEIEWMIAGYRSASGTGSVQLTTDRMLAEGTSPKTVTLGSTWDDTSSPPYTAAQHNDSSDPLDCYENHTGVVIISLKGDGTNKAFLMGANLWFKEIA